MSIELKKNICIVEIPHDDWIKNKIFVQFR